MILRCTEKALKLLHVAKADLVSALPSSEDWYLNLLWIERRKCVLLTHAGTLFPIFVSDVRAADLRPLGAWVAEVIESHLEIEGFRADALGPLDPASVVPAKTASRSILAVMRDTATHARYRVEAMGGLDCSDPIFLNRYLRRGLHGRNGEYVRPIDLVERLANPSGSEIDILPAGHNPNHTTTVAGTWIAVHQRRARGRS